MELFGKKLYLPDMLADGFQRGGDKTFVIYQRADGHRQEYSYREIQRQGQLLCQRLMDAGLRAGDSLGIVSAMNPWWYSILYASTLGHWRMVCIDPGIPLPQIHSMLRETRPLCVFTTLTSFRLPQLMEGRTPVYRVEEGFPCLNGCETVDALLAPATPMPEDAFFILFSSGTTGERRKCVLLPHSSVADAVEWNMATDAGIYKNTSGYMVCQRDLMLFPPYHIAGLLCASYDLYCNSQVILMERLTPQALNSVIQELRPDNISTVPAMLTVLMKKMRSALGKNPATKLLVNALLGVSGFFRRRLGWNVGVKLLGFLNRRALGGELRSFRIGSAPCSAETMCFFLNMGIHVIQAYGLTELGAPLAVTGMGYYPGTTGRVVRHGKEMDIRIVNPDEQGRGEVEVLSPFRMISYLNPQDMEGCFTPDGYFKTGDLGYFDKQQCLVIAGRAKEAIVLRNGEKLLPEEIEARYDGVVGLNQIAAFRVPDESGSDAFSLAAIKDKDAGWPDEVLRLQILDRAGALPAMYRPQEVYVLKELPLSSTRKVQRFRLTEMVEKGLDAPVSEASLRSVAEDGPAGELRALLVQIAGPQWKTVELTEGLLLNLDSLQTIELFTVIQEHFGLDMFRLENTPETFGALLAAVTEYEEADKKTGSTLDLSQYPVPVRQSEQAFFGSVGKLTRVIWNVHVSGRENIPADGNFLLCSNHMTVLDPVWIRNSLPRQQRRRTAIVGKSDLLEDALLKNLLRSHCFVPVDRLGNSMATLDRCRELLMEDWNVIIFPEGTNYENARELMSFKEGAARLAISTNKPILPVRIKGVKAMDTMHSTFLPPVGGRVELIFGTPISPEGKTSRELNELMRQHIAAL